MYVRWGGRTEWLTYEAGVTIIYCPLLRDDPAVVQYDIMKGRARSPLGGTFMFDLVYLAN